MAQTQQVEKPPLDRTTKQRKRRPDGTFAEGPDREHQRRAALAKHRKAYTPQELTHRMRQVVTGKAIAEVTANMLRIATGANGASQADQIQAARLLYDRVMGKPHQSMSVQHEQQPGSERVILQQIAVILDRQPDLRAMLTGEQQREIIDAPQDTSSDAAPQTQHSDPPPPQSD